MVSKVKGTKYDKAVVTAKSHILTNTKTGERLLIYSDKHGDVHERHLPSIVVPKKKRRAKK
jgi:hypothetical protein